MRIASAFRIPQSIRNPQAAIRNSHPARVAVHFHAIVNHPGPGPRAVVAALLSLLVPVVVSAQAGDGPSMASGDPPAAALGETLTRNASGAPTIHAFRVATPMTIDGRLEEPLYDQVRPVAEFVQQDPHEGSSATERTEAWVFFDRQNLYIAGRCWDTHPERLVANEMRRDNDILAQNDNFGASIDTFHDRRSATLFHTTAIGAMTDAMVVNMAVNKAWNTVWTVRTARFDRGWTVEIAIPFRSLRYLDVSPAVWGIQIRRIVSWKSEVSALTTIPSIYGRQGFSASWLFATLEGLEPPPRSRNLEIKPYAASSLTTDRASRPAVRNSGAADVGIDAKYGITRSLTADVTYNTDFAQVENDDQQVNLTRFGLFFPEKRDFFLEGEGTFAFGGINSRVQPIDDTPILFFSRRIGLENGRPVPIRAGARVTGRVNRYSIGALDIGTGDSVAAGSSASHFSVLRLKRDILRRSGIGLIATRRANADLTPDNTVFGADTNLSFFNSITINAFGATTRTTHLTGRDASYRAQFDYATERYGVQLTHMGIGGNFRPEVGFVSRRDMRRSFAQARFSRRPASMPSVRKLTYQGSFDYVASWDGRPQSRLAKATFRTDYLNGNYWAVDVNRHFEGLDRPFRIAQGVMLPAGGYEFHDVQATYFVDSKRRVSGIFTAGRGSFYDGTRTNAEYKGRITFPPRLTLEPTLSLNVVQLADGKFTTRLVGTRGTFSLSPRSFISTLVQYNSSAHVFGANLQLRWEYTPGSEFFLVYNDGRDTLLGERFPTLENRMIVAKVTRLFRF